MKQKLSVSVEQETIKRMETHVKSGSYRNMSHLVEFAVNKLIEENKNKER